MTERALLASSSTPGVVFVDGGTGSGGVESTNNTESRQSFRYFSCSFCIFVLTLNELKGYGEVICCFVSLLGFIELSLLHQRGFSYLCFVELNGTDNERWTEENLASSGFTNRSH